MEWIQILTLPLLAVCMADKEIAPKTKLIIVPIFLLAWGGTFWAEDDLSWCFWVILDIVMGIIWWLVVSRYGSRLRR